MVVQLTAPTILPVHPGTEMAARILALDEASSPLGPPSAWPQSLLNALGLMLPAHAQIVLFWGPDYVALYNDAYAPTIGAKHPAALGRPAAESFVELWDDLEPLLRRVRETRETFAAKDRPFHIERHGYREMVHFDASFSPVPDETGAVGGVLCIVSETTERVRAEQALRASEGRLRFLGELDEALRRSRDAAEAMATAAERLARRLGASRCAYADVDAGSGNDRFVIRRDYTAPGHTSSAGIYSLDLFGPRAAKAMHGGSTLVIRDIARELAADEGGAMFQAIGFRAIVCCPLVKDGRLAAMMAVHQDVARDWQPDEIGLVETVVERCWAHVERVGSEARLRESEERYRTLFEAIEAGFCIIEVLFDAEKRPVDYRFVEVNPAFETQTGLVGAVGRRMRELAPAHEEHWFEMYGRVATTGEPVRFENEAAALGRWFDVYAFKAAGPEQNRVVILFSDITARRQAEEELRQLNATLEHRVAERTAERQLLATIVDITGEQIQALDLEYRWLAINPSCLEAYRSLYGKVPKVGDCLLDMLADMPEHLAAAKTVWARALAGEAYTMQATWGDPELGERSYEMRFEILRDPAGRQVGAFLTGRDITERLAEQRRLEKAEEALRQSQKMEAIGHLTGGVAHDFNNLLTPIVGSLDLLQRKSLGGAREQRLITAAVQSAERAKTLVQRLLAFARRQPLQPVAVDVGRLVKGMGELVASTTGPQIRVSVEAPDDLPAAKADPNQLEMALLNLSVNARDAMPDGGTLRIAARSVLVGPGHRARLPAAHYICLSVADTGTGMDEATLARAVEPFFSTKGVGKGTGLGLSMVHGLASQLGGALTIQSRPGSGTVVELWLPQTVEAVEAAETPYALPYPLQRGTVLLVDDEDVVRLTTAEMLQDLGYAVTEAVSAEEALRMATGGVPFDMLLPAHLMPGMTGTELARDLRRRRPDLPVLLMSGFAEEHGVEDGIQRINKPFRKDELAMHLGQLGAGRG